MDETRRKQKRTSLILKTWERCKSLGRASKSSSYRTSKQPMMKGLTKKSKSWNGTHSVAFKDNEPAAAIATGPSSSRSDKRRAVPEGCFSVYVGPEKERFVLRTECVNHPLFRTLLEEAESEYGYNSGGPIELPCNVDFFYSVLTEMDCDADGDNVYGSIGGGRPRGCGYGVGAYRLLSPARMIAVSAHH